MKLDIVSLKDIENKKTESVSLLQNALLQKGIIGISDVPNFEELSRRFINTARMFARLSEDIKQKYTPNRDAGENEGYELGAERFKNKEGVWQTDDKKASYYAFVPDDIKNKWPIEVDLKTPYLELGKLIFNTGKLVLNSLGINQEMGLPHDLLVGYGRMLHYHKENDLTNENPNWCGAHLDHGILTGLIPAYYFQDDKEVSEPENAGLYIVPSNGSEFEKINVSEKNILLFQVGEFGQLLSNDHIKATKHKVRKTVGQIERFTFALFYSAGNNVTIKPRSVLTKDERYMAGQLPDGSIRYEDWQNATLARYRANKTY